MRALVPLMLGMAALIGQPSIGLAQDRPSQAENWQKRNTETQPDRRMGPLETDSKTAAPPTSPQGDAPEGMQAKPKAESKPDK
jgi:hypothetical protein